MHIDHWMTFGTFSEQRFFIYPSRDTYNGVIINGNMAVYAPDGLGQFILEKTDKLNYLVDPLTHAFQHDIEYLITENKDGERQIKTSIKALSDKLGNPINKIVDQERPIQPNDFKDKGILKEFVHNCLDFQSKQLTDKMITSDTNKKYLNRSEEDLSPYALITPYFYIDETTINDWLPIQSDCVKYSLEYKNNQKIFTSIVLDKGIISNKDSLNTIIKTFSAFDVDGFVIWIDDLNENETQISNLQGILELARKIKTKPSQEIINLHGGYFSILAAGVLGNQLFTGVTHGPEYGEHRSVVPVGGGIPLAKYYIRSLHKRTKYKEVVRALESKGWLKDSDSFHHNVCNCSKCKEVINNDIKNFVEFGRTNVKEVNRGTGLVRIEYPGTQTKENCLLHYLQMKSEEYKFSANSSKEEIINDLKKGIRDFEDTLGLAGVSHLKKWINIFE